MKSWKLKNTASYARAILCQPIDRIRNRLQNYLESKGRLETLKKLDRASFETIIRFPPYRSISVEDWKILYDTFMDHKEGRNGCNPMSQHESYKYFIETLKQPLSILDITTETCKGYHESSVNEAIERAEKQQGHINRVVVTNPQIYGFTSMFNKVMNHLLYDIPTEEVGLKLRSPEVPLD